MNVFTRTYECSMLKTTAIFGWNALSESLLKAIDQKLSTIRISKSENLPACFRSVSFQSENIGVYQTQLL